MSGSALMVEKYREHARQLRLVARDTVDPGAETLRTIANDYERLARTIEALARESRPARMMARARLDHEHGEVSDSERIYG